MNKVDFFHVFKYSYKPHQFSKKEKFKKSYGFSLNHVHLSAEQFNFQRKFSERQYLLNVA